MLTLLKPIIAPIRGTDHLDAFEHAGEPISVRHLCEDGVKTLLGCVPPELTPTKIILSARYLSDEPDLH